MCIRDSVVSVVHNLLCQSDVLLKRVFGAVNHHGGKASVNTGFADLKAVAMVKVQADGKARVLKGRLYELHQIDVLGIFSGPCRHLQDERRLLLRRRLRNPLNNLCLLYTSRCV